MIRCTAGSLTCTHDPREEKVLLLKVARDFFRKGIRFEEIGNPYSLPCHFVLVAGADAAARGPDFVLSFGLFPGHVNGPVVGEDEMGFLAQGKIPGRDLNAFLPELSHLFQQNLRVDDHAVADQTFLPLVENARGNKMTDGLFAVHDERMATP